MVLFPVFFICLSGCIDEYWPDMNTKYEEVLVVDGLITDQPGPYVVKLSLTSNVNDPGYIPVSGYSVSLQDNMGNSEMLTDHGNGEYRSAENGITGIPGRSYKINIESPNGNKYESSFETLNPPVGIDSIYSQVEYQEAIHYNYDLAGLRFYLDTKTASTDTVNFLWRITATYKYNANYLIKYYYDGVMHPFTDPDSLYTCWKTYSVDQIFTTTTSSLTEPVIIKHPLHFVSTEGKELSIRYSLLAEQISISKPAYNYWKSIEDISSNQGSMYAILPYQVRGNIKNLSNTDEPVLGYFHAGGISKKRIFVDRPDLDFHYITTCEIITEDMYTMLWLMREKWPVYLIALYGEYGQSPALPGNQACVDCTQHGGTIIQPDFWTENQLNE